MTRSARAARWAAYGAGALAFGACSTDKTRDLSVSPVVTADAATDDPHGHPGQVGPRELPCAVQMILDQRCGTCHGNEPAYGAPMSLWSWHDVQQNGKSTPVRPVYELIKARIHDTTNPMPPTTQLPLLEAERAVLDGWLDQGAPKSDERCASDGSVVPGDDGHGDGGAPAACDMTLELRAHGASSPGDSSKYPVPSSSDHYECFYFKVPWQEKLHALRIEPLIDDKRVVHHWLLYQQSGLGLGDGAHESCSGAHPNATLVAGWAPGGEGAIMPKDVGLKLPEGPDSAFVLEIHYNNSAGHKDAQDRSGARICATDKLQPNEASVHWLGTEAIAILPGGGTAGSTCTPRGSAPIHIISSWPHMHKLGKHMQTLITRADGKTEMLIDKPFDFNSQVSWPTPAVINPGDSLKTTCTWSDPGLSVTTFGPKTNDEMCYNFVTAYPAGSLNTGGSVIGGDDKCML